MELQVQPLSAKAFSPYGEVIGIPATGEPGVGRTSGLPVRAINGGTSQRFDMPGGQGLRGIALQFHQPLHAVERVGEDPLDPPLRAVEIDEDRESRTARTREEDGRAVDAEQPPLDLGDLEMRIDRMRNLDEFSLAAEGVGTGLE